MSVIMELLAAGAIAFCGAKIADLIWAAITVPAERTGNMIRIAIWSAVAAAVYIPALLYVPHGNPAVFPILCAAVFLSPLLARLFILSRSRAG
tara:strand:+ start:377 stop:655 length:279 start_codon:yes stop_codon:yes gene_type:complete